MNISNDSSISSLIGEASYLEKTNELKEKIYEEKRLKELDYYEILHTEGEKEYDEITKLASYICGKPISIINLMHMNKAWIKSKSGLEGLSEFKHTDVFCSLIIKSKANEVLEIQNTSSDKRRKLLDIPENVELPYKYYAGYPLKTVRGYNIGTLCVMDLQPGEMSKEQKNALKILASQVMKMIELNKRNKELKQAGEKILSLAKVKQDFFSNISHELRSPLNAIYGFTELLSEEDANLNLNKKQKEYVEIIKTSIENLIVIINDILDLSKIESGKFRLNQEPFSLKETLDSVAKLFLLKAETKGLQFVFEYDEGIDNQLLGDKVRIYQILVNLLGNSLKFTEKGFFKLRVKRINNLENHFNASVNDNKHNDNYINRINDDLNVKSETDETYVQNILFSIEDSGIGISEEQTQRLFERFEQADEKINTKYGGTGLGLNIVKSLVTLQGGQINVKSELGKGSTFYFNLKLKRCKKQNIMGLEPNIKLNYNVKAEEENQLKNQKHSGLNTVDNNKIVEKIKSKIIKDSRTQERIKILLMEDISVNTKYFQKIFEKKDYIIETVENGKLGIDLILSKKNIDYFDIIFLDLNMPEMNGFQTAKNLRQNLSCKSKIWAMTSNDCEEERKYCLSLGMDDYISKPIHKNVLYEKIENYIKDKFIYGFDCIDFSETIDSKEDDCIYDINESEGGLNSNKPFNVKIKVYKNKDNLDNLSKEFYKNSLNSGNKDQANSAAANENNETAEKPSKANNTSLDAICPQNDIQSSFKISVINNYKIEIYQSENINKTIKRKENNLEESFNAKEQSVKFKAETNDKRNNSIKRESKTKNIQKTSKLNDIKQCSKDKIYNILNHHRKDNYKQNELFKNKFVKFPERKENKLKENDDNAETKVPKNKPPNINYILYKSPEKNLNMIKNVKNFAKENSIKIKELGAGLKLNFLNETKKPPMKTNHNYYDMSNYCKLNLKTN